MRYLEEQKEHRSKQEE